MSFYAYLSLTSFNTAKIQSKIVSKWLFLTHYRIQLKSPKIDQSQSLPLTKRSRYDSNRLIQSKHRSIQTAPERLYSR